MHLIKIPGGFRPANDQDSDTIAKIKNGSLVECKISQPRNAKFHRKYFALLNLGFESWEPPATEWGGMEAQKNFDTFREQVQILAGYREVVVDIRGQAKVVSKSISFASMSEEEFASLYKAVFSVIWSHVMSKIKGYSEAEMERVINTMLSFD